MQQHGFNMPHGVDAICVGSDEQRREDVRNSGAKRVAKNQTGLALTDESREHAFSKVVAHGCVLDLAEGNESGVLVEKVTIGISKGAVVFYKAVAEVTLSSFLHGFHQGQGVLAVVGEPRGGRQVFN